MVNVAGKQTNAGDTVATEVWRLLGNVPDPEIPVLSVVDLGIIRHVHAGESGVRVGVSPTYSGCPATEVIRGLIQRQLRSAGFENVQH